ncbi:MAG: polysaccharide deacetylase family protein [bacterium]
MAQEPGGVILQYHHVDSTTPVVTSISTEHFQQHLDYLADNNFQVWSLQQFAYALRDKTEIPDKVISITFDDAYANVYDNAWPLLRQHNFPSTLFVTTELVGNRSYLSWDQLREMKALGVTIANHSHSHPHMLRRAEVESEDQWLARIRWEINKAQELLQANLGDIPKLFAFPYGEYDLQVLELVESLGYIGFGQQSGAAGYTSSLLTLPRFPLSGNYSDFETFKIKSMTLPMPLSASVIDPVLTEKNLPPALVLNFLHDDYSFHALACYGPGGITHLQQQSPTTFVATSKTALSEGLSRYNCTMPVAGSNRFYWFSQLWILQ